MQLTLLQLDFTVSLNSCHDEIMHKMEVLTNMEIQLLRKFQHQLGNLEMHYQMIHDVRVMIVNLEEVFKDVKEYFNQMGIQFVYDFFRKIQVLMVCGYNFMSQALLVNVDKIEDKRSKDAATKGNLLECKVCKCTCQNSKFKKRQIKEVQHFDYTISMLQNEQQKLSSEIQNIYEKMMMQKAMIEKTKPSLAIRELEDMKEHIQNVMQSTNSIFEETYMMKYVEFKNYLTQIKKPEDIVDYFISNMTFNMKEKFLKAMQKAIYKAQNMEERLERKHLRDVEIQTEKVKEIDKEASSTYRGFSSLKPQKNSSLLTKQRKYNEKMVAEVGFIRKQLNSLMSENQKLRKQVESKEVERLKFEQNYETLQQLYGKRTFELQQVQSENKWLASQKQTQTKKLRHQIKQLKKEQVQMVSEETQTFIPPNYVSSSTQTEIIYFQNQVDNEIINVLKKSNEKMIISLNEKQKKIRELKVNKDELVMLKECKTLCLGFLEDLREVTAYKMKEMNKDSPNINNLSQEKQKYGYNYDKLSKQPIIPLNEYTCNSSVMATVGKLSEEIKTLLFPPQVHKRSTDRRRSSKKQSLGSLINSKRSSKVSEFSSEHSVEAFFRNTNSRKSSVNFMQKETQVALTSEFKKSCYQKEFMQRNEKKRSGSQSSISEKQSRSNRSKRSMSSKGHRDMMDNSFDGRIEIKDVRRMSTFSNKKSTHLIQNKPKHKTVVCQAASIQTDILRPRTQANSYSYEQSGFALYGEYMQQTDITCEQLGKFQQRYQSQSEEVQKLKVIASANNIGAPLQSYSTRKHPYIRKPGGRMTADKLRTLESDRNFVSVNHSLPMNENQISQSIQEHIGQSRDDISFMRNNTSIVNEAGFSSLTNRASNNSNMTLQSRLQAIINPKNRTNAHSGLVVFKKPNKNYEKRSSQMVFDELKMDKNLRQKQKQPRRSTFNIYQSNNLSSIIQPDKKQWQEMISKIKGENEIEKENFYEAGRGSKPKNQVHLKSIFIEKIVEEEDNLSYSRSNNEPLIDVTKKTPIERERRMSPRSYEPPESVFARTVKQMLMSTESKEGLIKKIEEVYKSMESQKEQKKLKKIMKTSYTPRNSDQRKNQRLQKQNSQIFKLGDTFF